MLDAIDFAEHLGMMRDDRRSGGVQADEYRTSWRSSAADCCGRLAARSGVVVVIQMCTVSAAWKGSARMTELTNAIGAVRSSIVQIRLLSLNPFVDNTLGTGFLVNEDAIVVTANHVVAVAWQQVATLPNARVMVGLAVPNTETMRGNFVAVGCRLSAVGCRLPAVGCRPPGPAAPGEVEGRMLRVDCDGRLVERGGRLGRLRCGWAGISPRFAWVAHGRLAE